MCVRARAWVCVCVVAFVPKDQSQNRSQSQSQSAVVSGTSMACCVESGQLCEKMHFEL